MKSIFRLIVCTTFLLCSLFPTIALSFTPEPDKVVVEQELLTKARKNIETYRKGDVTLVFTDNLGNPVRDLQVEINQISHDFLFGNLFEQVYSAYKNGRVTKEEWEKHEKYFLELYNFTAIETVKWPNFEKQQGITQWEELLSELQWCQKNGVLAKGHTLGWTNTSGTPEWLKGLSLEMTYDLMKARTNNIVRGFKDHFRIWDVVNEPVTTYPWDVAMRDSIVGRSEIGTGRRYDVNYQTPLEEIIPWVENLLRWTSEADPDAHLMLNEFHIMSTPKVREKFFELNKELQRRGVPLHGVGIQAHEPRTMWFSPVEIVKVYDMYSELGIPIHITEFIPQSGMKEITGGWRQGVWTEEAQAEFAEQFYILTFGHPSVASIHYWGLSDRIVWQPGGGLLDRDFNPKPIYYRLRKLIREDWMTKNVVLKSTRKGETVFRGFFGKYEITVMAPDGIRKSFGLHLQKDGQNHWTFEI